MSEFETLQELKEGVVTHSATEVTAGIMMRTAREAAGLHVAALAVSMKIPVKKLEALEADRLDLLHDAVFVRALASSVCRALKIDPVPVLQKLPLTKAPRLNVDESGINAPFHATGDLSKNSIGELARKPTVLVVLGLLAAGATILFFPEAKLAEWAASFNGSSAKVATAEPAQPFPPQVMPEIVEKSLQVESPEQKSVGDPASPNDSAALPLSVALAPTSSSSTPTPAAPVSAPIAVNPVRSPVPQVASGLVVFKVRGASWIQVVDAKGVVQLNKTLAEGETMGASGTTPLAVVIGRADVTEVEVRGKPYSLANVAKDNVARFEVK